MVWESPAKKTWEEYDEESRAGLLFLWTHGKLAWKLDPDQFETYEAMHAYFDTCKTSYERLWVNEWSRRLGKDFLTWVIVRERSRREKNKIFHYGTAFEKDINLILIPIINEIEKDCPPHLCLVPQQAKGMFYDPVTKTEIRLVGLDVNPNGIRGNRGDMIVVTEYGYCSKIEESETAFSPMLVENRDAMRVYNSTPPESTGHKWCTEIVPKAQMTGNYSLRILDDCPRFDKDQIDAAYEEFGGYNTTKSRREYRCEHVGEETKMLIPEWLETKKVCLVEDYQRPEHAHCYVVTDPGSGESDLFGFLFGYYDFLQNLYVIQRAFTLKAPTTSQVADTLAKNERELWGDFTYHDQRTKRFIKNPYLRVNDSDLRLIKDMSEDYDMDYKATRKDDLRSAVNEVRTWVQSQNIRILPEAKELAIQLDAGIWDKNRKKFAYVSPVLGHFDLVACLVYGIRNLDLNSNPLPPKARSANEFFVGKPKETGIFEVRRDKYGNVIDKTFEMEIKI